MNDQNAAMIGALQSFITINDHNIAGYRVIIEKSKQRIADCEKEIADLEAQSENLRKEIASRQPKAKKAKPIAVGDTVTFEGKEYEVVRADDTAIAMRRPAVFGGIEGMYDAEITVPVMDERFGQIKRKGE